MDYNDFEDYNGYNDFSSFDLDIQSDEFADDYWEQMEAMAEYEAEREREQEEAYMAYLNCLDEDLALDFNEDVFGEEPAATTTAKTA